jgi:hypothetical protein
MPTDLDTLTHESTLKICSPCSRLAFEMKLTAGDMQVSTRVRGFSRN